MLIIKLLHLCLNAPCSRRLWVVSWVVDQTFLLPGSLLNICNSICIWTNFITHHYPPALNLPNIENFMLLCFLNYAIHSSKLLKKLKEKKILAKILHKNTFSNYFAEHTESLSCHLPKILSQAFTCCSCSCRSFCWLCFYCFLIFSCLCAEFRKVWIIKYFLWENEKCHKQMPLKIFSGKQRK